MSDTMFSLKGKTAVITGGAVNIGNAVSRRLAYSGASVAVVYNSSAHSADKLVSELRNAGCIAKAFKADISNEVQVVRLFKEISDDPDFDTVDILVNNSGVLSVLPQEELSADEWDRVFAVNTRGLFLCSREAAKIMKANKASSCAQRGSIINIASINALHPGFGNTAHYDATKGAVAAYTASLAAELGPSGIRVNAVAPGLVESDALREGSSELAEMVEARNPLKCADGSSRLVTGEDIASTVLFLASGASASITGGIITVDRGYLLS